jgi:hypothetical protein
MRNPLGAGSSHADRMTARSGAMSTGRSGESDECYGPWARTLANSIRTSVMGKTVPPPHDRRTRARTRTELFQSRALPVPQAPPEEVAKYDPARFGYDVMLALAVPPAGGPGSLTASEKADDGREMRK